MCAHDRLIAVHHLPIVFFWIKEPLLRTAKLYWLIDPSDLQSKEEKNTKHEWLGPTLCFGITSGVFVN